MEKLKEMDLYCGYVVSYKVNRRIGRVMKKAAIVTGASSGIGLAISKMLIKQDFLVYGFGRTFDESEALDNTFKSFFHQVVCDITDTKQLIEKINAIRQQHTIKLLVNNAGVGFYGPHETLNSIKIQQMVRTNLEAPMIITNILLCDLKKTKGTIVNISSVTATKSNTHGCVYGATKAGLTSFSHSLFDEVRKTGVKVINIQPDMTKTNLYRNADFSEDEDILVRLDPREVADIIEYIINCRDGLVISDVTLKPQLHRIKKKIKSSK